MNTKDVLAQIEKYLSGGQKLDALEKWISANSAALADGEKSNAMVASQIEVDIIELRQGIKTEKTLREGWRRMLDGMKYSRK